MSNTEFITNLYRGFLGREPESGAVEGWHARMDGGMTPQEVVSAFAGSEEYRKRQADDVDRGRSLFVPPGHFYSPVVNVEEVRADIDRPVAADAPLAGLDMDPQAMLRVWEELLPHLRRVPFEAQPKQGLRYYAQNSAFGMGDASIYFAMLLRGRPRRIVEVGSGYSSACALDAIEQHFGGRMDMTFVEPYPQLLRSLLKPADLDQVRILESGVQQAPLEVFERLESGDILFIDSTHVLKTRSDVHHELFEILPRLKAGVLIHIHDIFWPFEYPRHWVIDENRSWNELYGLRAYLMYNDTFRVEFFNSYFVQTFNARAQKDYPAMFPNTGGSIWLRKVR